MEAAECVTSQEAQVDLALTDGLMPSTNTAYEAVIEDGSYPADLVELWRTSVDEGGPRPKSAFYGLISSAIQARWHSPNSVDPDTTPKDRPTTCKTSSKERRCCDHDDRTGTGPHQGRHQRPLPFREPARPEAGRTRDHPDADRHRVPDAAGDLAVGLQLLAHRARRRRLRRPGELPDRPDRPAVLADHRHHGVLHGGHRRDRAGHRVRLRHGDAPADLRPRRRAHLDPRSPTASSRSSPASPGSSPSRSRTGSSTAGSRSSATTSTGSATRPPR